MEDSLETINYLTQFRFVCLSICYKEHVREDIKKVYKENEIENFEAFSRTKLYNTEGETVFSKQDVKLHQSCNYLYSMYARMLEISSKENLLEEDHLEIEKIFTFIFDICKKAYRYVYNYIINNPRVDLGHFYYDYVFSKNKNIPDNERMFATIVLLFLVQYCKEKDSRLDKEIYDTNIIDTMNTNIGAIEMASYLYPRIKEEDYSEGLKDWKKKYQKSLTKKNYYIALQEMQMCEYTQTSQDLKTLVKERKRLSQEGDVTKHLSNLTGWLRAYGIELNVLSEKTPLNYKHIEDIFSYINYKDRSYDEVCAMFPALMITDMLINEIKDLQNMYFKVQKNEEILRYKKLRDEINIEKEEILKESENFRMEKFKLYEKNSSLEAENKSLQKEIKKLKLELEKKNSEHEELLGLREYIFNSQNDLEKEEIYQEEIFNPETIKNEKILIIGGQVAWQNKIKEILPRATFLGENQLNFDLKLLKKHTHIAFKINFLSHAMYYRVADNISPGTKIGYLSEHNNIDISLQELKKLLTSERRNYE